MIHVAILNKAWKLLDKIKNGEKSIESRWYKIKAKPWDIVREGDIIYFKDSGEPITVKAIISRVVQYDNLNHDLVMQILNQYHKEICLENRYTKFYENRKYCILIFLKEIEILNNPIIFDKSGFGISSAWICISNINEFNKRIKRK